MSFKIVLFLALAWAAPRPKDIVDVKTIDPSLEVQMAYFSDVNFVGKRIDGYKANICYLNSSAAQALKMAQARLKKKNASLTLLIYDCYRPQKAVAHFMRWVKEAQREDLIKDGYIAPLSEHSRGFAVDLTIAAVAGEMGAIPVEMGGQFDLFSNKSHSNFQGIPKEARANRKMLADAMAPDFAPYPQEWWHFTFKSKTASDRMDFDVAP